MKIRHPWLIKALAFFGALLVRLWVGTLRYRYRPLGPNVDPNQPGFKDRGRYLYAFWHEYILIPAYHYGRPDIRVLISKHADGELIARVASHLGFRVVRGSSGRAGSVEAVRQMVKLAGKAHLAFTPDGPRGPRRRVQTGLIYLAAQTGLPIVPIGLAFARAWRMRSWDRFAVPVPWSAASCVTAEPIVVPSTSDRDVLEAYRLKVEEAMNRATAAAERMHRPAPPRREQARKAA
jgi:lysophospholipid acyltransferase (LPLAT)-like uncharacterized protein